MNKYEAMMIFPETLKDEGLDAALEKVKAEIEKAGGRVESTTRLGRRPFARPLDKMESGNYMVVSFHMGGDKISGLLARFKLNEELFRVQIVRAPVIKDDKPAAPAVT